MQANDLVRHAILEYLNDINSKSRGVSGASVGIRKIQASLKKKYDYKQQ